MRATPGIHVEWIDGEALALDQETGALHYLNPSAALAYALILEHGYAGGVARLRQDHGDIPELEDQLEKLVGDLLATGLLTEG